jgi:putative addiction module killer protein
MAYKIHLFQTRAGRKPYQDWLESIKDGQTRTRISGRMFKVQRGLLGDYKGLTDQDGLCEFRLDFGSGYRIYFTFEGEDVILLFAGSDKDDQQRAIAQAAFYMAEYRKR